MDAKVVNCKSGGKYDVYIGRPSKWGNPFVIGKDGSREDVVRKYREWILTQDDLLKDLQELKGKTLGCFCAPQACHGDVLVELADKATIKKTEIRFHNNTWLVKHISGGFAGVFTHRAVEVTGGQWFEIEEIDGLTIHVEGHYNVCDCTHTYLLNVPQSLYEVRQYLSI
jgi:hypothetical protein